MIQKSIKIQLNGGLEARPIAMLVQVASQHESSVYIETDWSADTDLETLVATNEAARTIAESYLK